MAGRVTKIVIHIDDGRQIEIPAIALRDVSLLIDPYGVKLIVDATGAVLVDSMRTLPADINKKLVTDGRVVCEIP